MPTTEKPKRKPNAALLKPVQPDAVLAAVIGSTPVSRGELTKKVWDYIKKNGLQDKTKKINYLFSNNYHVNSFIIYFNKTKLS